MGYLSFGIGGLASQREPFMQDVRAISDLKLRASWGLVGNNRIGNYDAIARTSTSYYTS